MREAFATTALVVALVGLAGCAGLSADPARYTGRTDKDPIPVAAVREEPSRPPDYELLGEVTARCRADDGVVVLDHEALADVDCSDALLEAALKEKAASVGGAVLTGLRCEVTEQSKGDRLASELHRCSARVASPRSADGSVPRPLAMAGDSYASPAQAFRVQVSLRPAEPGAAPRHARPADRVAELAYVPPGRVVLGDIVARCGGDCDRAVVRHAVRAAAGRVGATDVVGIACVRRHRGFQCTGQATRPEVDEWAVR